MTTQIRFANKCEIHTGTKAKNDAGQWVTTYNTVVTRPCTFLYLATDEKAAPMQIKEDIIEVILDHEIEITYDDIIKNIKDRWGSVIEAGPLEIIGIKKYTGFQGKLHHYRIRTRKSKAC